MASSYNLEPRSVQIIIFSYLSKGQPSINTIEFILSFMALYPLNVVLHIELDHNHFILLPEFMSCLPQQGPLM